MIITGHICKALKLWRNIASRPLKSAVLKAVHPVWKFFGTLVKGTVAVFGFKAISDVAETIATNSGDSVVYTNSGNAIGGDNSYSPVDIATDISTGDTGYVGDTPTWVGDDQSSVFRDIDLSQTVQEP